MDRDAILRNVDSDRGIPLGRAAFLGTVAAGISGIALASRFSSTVSDAMSGVAGAIPVVNEIAPTSGWRIYSVNPPMPVFDAKTYRLKIGGEVAKPVELTYDELLALPAVEQVSDFHCVTGWSVPNVKWRGVQPQTLIDLVQPRAGLRQVTFASLEDPYVDGLSPDQFALPDTLIATHMDGLPLSRAHGAPVRVVVPQMYGYKGVKWLSDIRFDLSESTGYWEQRGYDVDAWIGRSNGLG
jgi:DMSO/TMAO reductase YedYZ molybdopterin-dependent catalytic subunit